MNKAGRKAGTPCSEVSLALTASSVPAGPEKHSGPAGIEEVMPMSKVLNAKEKRMLRAVPEMKRQRDEMIAGLPGFLQRLYSNLEHKDQVHDNLVPTREHARLG